VAYQPRWLTPQKIVEYYVFGAPGVRSRDDADYQLYWAVRDGEVRARHEGKPLTEEDLIQFAATASAGGTSYELPYDILLSADDAERVWGDEGDLATRIALGELSAAGIEERVRSRIISLEFLLDRAWIQKAGDIDKTKKSWDETVETRERLISEIEIGLAHVAGAAVQAALSEKFSNTLARMRALVEELTGNQRAASNISGEHNCTKWLTRLMQGGSDPEKPKAEYWNEARDKFSVSHRGFNRAWGTAVSESGNQGWSKPGRKS
jgi:hypothetical protein